MMRKIFTSKEILETCLKNKEKEEKILNAKNKEEVESEIEENAAAYINREINKSINTAKYNKFRSNIKSYFLAEALSYIFNNSIHLEVAYENNDTVKRNIVNKFVKENNVDSLLKSFENKSVLLSELANIINEKYNIVIESIDKENPDTFCISDDVDKDFFKELEDLDINDVTKTIKIRVADAMNEFIQSNTAAKIETKEILKQAQNKINELNKNEDTSDSLKESFERVYKKKINDIRNNKRKNVLEAMIYGVSESVIKNEELKKIYFENGRIDMDKIVESCSLMYTFLETVNTCKIIDIDENYISDLIKNL